MRTSRQLFSQLKSARIFFLIVALVNIGLVAWWWFSAHKISYESGPLENFQAAALFLVLVIFLFKIRKLEGAGRTAAMIICLATFSMLLREVDFRTMPVSDLVLSITTGHFRDSVFGLSFLLIFVVIISQFKHFQMIVAAMLHWRAWPYYLWIGLIIAGEMAEEVSRANGNMFWDFTIPHGQFWEEMLELNAYGVLLFASITFFKFSRHISEYAEHAPDIMRGIRSIFSRPACVTISAKL
jgi:hypothetical protein